MQKYEVELCNLVHVYTKFQVDAEDQDEAITKGERMNDESSWMERIHVLAVDNHIDPTQAHPNVVVSYLQDNINPQAWINNFDEKEYE